MMDMELQNLLLRLEVSYGGTLSDAQIAVWTDHLRDLDFVQANAAIKIMETEERFPGPHAFSKHLVPTRPDNVSPSAHFSPGTGWIEPTVDRETGEITTGLTDKERIQSKQLARVFAMQSVVAEHAKKTSEHDHRFGPRACPVCKLHDPVCHKIDAMLPAALPTCPRCKELAEVALEELAKVS